MGRNSEFHENTGTTAGAFLEGNPNRTTYSFVGKAKDLSKGLALAGRANPMGPNTHIRVNMKDSNNPKVSTHLRKKK